MLRKKNLYIKGTTKNFRISRSKVDLFINCKRCFWLDRVKGLGMIQPPPFTLNNAVDSLLKNEFDHYRSIQQPHPIFLENGLNFVPYNHSKLEDWRENFKGLEYIDNELGLIFTGAVDDLWLNLDNNKVIVVDYKATSKVGSIEISNSGWWPSYKRQIEFYQFLLFKNNIEIENYSFFLYANGLKEGHFNSKIDFDLTLIKYEGSLSWIPKKLKEIKSLLDQDNVPDCNSSCKHCEYFEDRQNSFRRLTYGQNMDLFD
jgi:hypothetical protein